MKVLQVMAGGPYGGAECMFRDTVAALHQSGLEQVVVTRRTPLLDSVLPKLGLVVINARFDQWWQRRTKFALSAAWQGFRPDLVQYWMARAASYSRGGTIPPQIPRIGWLGGYSNLRHFKGCDFLVGVTQDLRRHIIDAGVSPERAVTIHTFAEINPNPALSRAEYNTPDSAPLLLALGRLHHHKGFDILIEAVKQLPQAHLWIAGEGEARAELEQQIQRGGLQQRVRLLGWRHDREALLATADIFVMPSRVEPFGTVMAEAWAAKLPLVVAAAQGPQDYVRPNDNALMVPKGRVDELVQALSSLIADQDLRARLIEGGQQTYQQQFTKQIMVNDYLAFYQYVLERSKSGL